MDFRIGNGYDIHRLEENRKLILGGVLIPYEKGFMAHSDGDALIHAIIDALLGALSLGDIGSHFPDNDIAYKDIDSCILLKKTLEIVEQENYEIVNIDTNIIAQKPKLASYIPSIIDNLAFLTNLNKNQISVKAKTKEKMDAVGECKAIETNAVVLLKKIKY